MNSTTTQSETVPEMFGVRPDDDVRLLLAIAIEQPGRDSKNWNRIANNALRNFLTPKLATKRILNLQEKMGVKIETALIPKGGAK